MFVEFNFDTRRYTLRDRQGGHVVASSLPAYEAERKLDAPMDAAQSIMAVARDAAFRANKRRVAERTTGDA